MLKESKRKSILLKINEPQSFFKCLFLSVYLPAHPFSTPAATYRKCLPERAESLSLRSFCSPPEWQHRPGEIDGFHVGRKGRKILFRWRQQPFFEHLICVSYSGGQYKVIKTRKVTVSCHCRTLSFHGVYLIGNFHSFWQAHAERSSERVFQ